jgi:hypothetical protein
MVGSQRLQQEFLPEENVLKMVVLEILHRPQSQAISLKEIAQELAGRYDNIELERCLLALSEQGLVELAYTSGYSVGFRARPQSHW